MRAIAGSVYDIPDHPLDQAGIWRGHDRHVNVSAPQLVRHRFQIDLQEAGEAAAAELRAAGYQVVVLPTSPALGAVVVQAESVFQPTARFISPLRRDLEAVWGRLRRLRRTVAGRSTWR